MHALQAKTGENRRFGGGVSEELSSVEMTWASHKRIWNIYKFQKNLVVWKFS